MVRPLPAGRRGASGNTLETRSARLCGCEFGLWILRGIFYFFPVSRKQTRVAALAGQFSGETLQPYYAGYFILFNRQEFYKAHDVLEQLWLPDKHGVNGNFYKGLIQLAGAFVHLQKNRLRPAAALFKLARANLEKYPPVHEHLDVRGTRRLIGRWLGELEQSDFQRNPLDAIPAPELKLETHRK